MLWNSNAPPPPPAGRRGLPFRTVLPTWRGVKSINLPEAFKRNTSVDERVPFRFASRRTEVDLASSYRIVWDETRRMQKRKRIAGVNLFFLGSPTNSIGFFPALKGVYFKSRGFWSFRCVLGFLPPTLFEFRLCHNSASGRLNSSQTHGNSLYFLPLYTLWDAVLFWKLVGWEKSGKFWLSTVSRNVFSQISDVLLDTRFTTLNFNF